MKANYERRIRERAYYYLTGIIAVAMGIGLFILAVTIALMSSNFDWTMTLMGFAQIVVGFGAIFVAIFGRIGWASSILADILLNRLSVCLTIIGFVGITVGFVMLDFREHLALVAGCLVAIILGLILAVIGIHSTPKTFEEYIESDRSH